MDKWLDLKQQELVKYSVRICVCVCMCASHRVWLWGRARCCFGTFSPENKRLGSLRPHQLPSTLGQWRENQITCDHKHSPNKCNAVMWGCCWKMTDMGGRPEPCQEYIKKTKHNLQRKMKEDKTLFFRMNTLVMTTYRPDHTKRYGENERRTERKMLRLWERR